MNNRRMGTCTPVEQYCLAPAGNKPVWMAVCYHCGDTVCRNCSWKRKEGRICSTCLVATDPKGELKLWTRLFRKSGYQNPTKCAKEEIAMRESSSLRSFFY